MNSYTIIATMATLRVINVTIFLSQTKHKNKINRYVFKVKHVHCKKWSVADTPKMLQYTYHEKKSVYIAAFCGMSDTLWVHVFEHVWQTLFFTV